MFLFTYHPDSMLSARLIDFEITYKNKNSYNEVEKKKTRLKVFFENIKIINDVVILKSYAKTN
jgi:hypothetical protein